MRATIFTIGFFSILFLSCKTGGPEPCPPPLLREYSVQSVLWQQNAGEYRALCYQAYNAARHQLEEQIALNSDASNLAIITDLDETVLDNSPYNAWMIQKDQDYTPETWKNWVEKEEALALPGAVDFFNHVEALGVQVFYISNRKNEQLEATMNNMKALRLPFIEEDHFLLKTTTSGKQERRNAVLENHKVVLLMGDNLSDFTENFEKL
ncbi:MAG: 5'-nucleotidase, lipoprotein e(P4) family, partial [Bacteroidota bacterium]